MLGYVRMSGAKFAKQTSPLSVKGPNNMLG